MARRKTHSVSFLLKAVTYLATLWLLGFAYFFVNMPKPRDEASVPQSDAIIVLTGGAGRLEAGLRLLEQKTATRMLVSGVNPVVEARELSALTGVEEALFTCCVDLDRTAPDTIGNANESATWARGHGYRTLVLVTADYHMPRSLILFRRAMPEATFVAHPVKGDWPLPFLANEYNKYLVTLVGEAFRTSPKPDATADSSRDEP